MTIKDSNNLVNIEELAEYLGISVATVRRMAKRGDIPFIVLGGSYLFTIDSVQDRIIGNTFKKQRAEPDSVE